MTSIVSTNVDTTYLFFDVEPLIIEARKQSTVAVFCGKNYVMLKHLEYYMENNT